MDRCFLFSNYLDSDNKLTRAASFSELSAKKITFEQRVHTEACGELIRQYSCEEIFNKESNTRQYTMSQTVKSDKEELSGTWKYTVPRQSSLKECEWPSISNKGYSLQKHFSVPNQNMSRANSDTSSSRIILTPGKLIISKNNLRQSQSSQILSRNETSSSISMLAELTSNTNIPSVDKSLILDNQVDNITNDKNFTLQKIVTDNNNTDEKDDEKVTIQNSNVIKIKRDIFTQDDDAVVKTKRDLLTQDNNAVVKTKRDITEWKKTLRSLVKKSPKKRKNIFTAWSIAFSILLPIAVLNLAFFLNNSNISKDFCNPMLKINKLEEELSSRIYGQDEAIEKLIKYFKIRENWSGFDVVALIGGTGVGKSYTFDIIKNSLKGTNNFFDFFPPIYKKEDQAYTLLSACRCNLIRLENLKTEDIPDIVKFSNDLRKRIKNYCVVILAIFNPQVTDHNLKRTMDLEKTVSLVEEKLKEADFQPTVIGFTSLSDKALMNCIKDAADYANVELNVEETDRVMRDLLTADSGCKGAYAKVQVVGKNKQVFS